MKKFKIIAIPLMVLLTTAAFASEEKKSVQESNPLTEQAKPKDSALATPTPPAATPPAETKSNKSDDLAKEPNTTDAKTQTTSSNNIKEPAEFQKVISEYKKYVAKVPAEVREEVIAYRKEIAKINKDKRALYRKLSQASQEYLQTEQEYKKKLPINRKSLINIETPGEKVKNK